MTAALTTQVAPNSRESRAIAPVSTSMNAAPMRNMWTSKRGLPPIPLPSAEATLRIARQTSIEPTPSRSTSARMYTEGRCCGLRYRNGQSSVVSRVWPEYLDVTSCAPSAARRARSTQGRPGPVMNVTPPS